VLLQILSQAPDWSLTGSYPIPLKKRLAIECAVAAQWKLVTDAGASNPFQQLSQVLIRPESPKEVFLQYLNGKTLSYESWTK